LKLEELLAAQVYAGEFRIGWNYISRQAVLFFKNALISFSGRHFRYKFAPLKRAQALPKVDFYPMNSLERLIENPD
jgi:hypothetical protein